MSGKTLSAKSVESGILEPRKNTIGSCSTVLLVPHVVVPSLSISIGSGVSCYTFDNVKSILGTGSGSTYFFVPSPLGAFGGMGIPVNWSERDVGF